METLLIAVVAPRTGKIIKNSVFERAGENLLQNGILRCKVKIYTQTKN